MSRETITQDSNTQKGSANASFEQKTAALPSIAPFDFEQIPGWREGFVANFTCGMARGTEEELMAAAKAEGFDAKLEGTEIPGIFEMKVELFSRHPDSKLPMKDFIVRYPSLKVTGFLEDRSPALEVWIAYSESGYPYVTEAEAVGHFDNKSDLCWHEEIRPTEDYSTRFHFIQSGELMSVRYKFPFRKKWEDRYYYTIDGGETYRLILREGKQPLPYDSPKLWKLKKSEMYAGNAYVQEYLGDETDVRFPEKVGDMCIQGICARKGAVPSNYERIETVQLPKGYHWIGAHAFQGCKALREITFPQDLDQIGAEAFADCTALKKVVFNDICEKKTRKAMWVEDHEKKPIGDGLFKNCTALEEVLLATKQTVLDEENIFNGCGDYKIIWNKKPDEIIFAGASVLSYLSYKDLPKRGECLTLEEDHVVFKSDGTKTGFIYLPFQSTVYTVLDDLCFPIELWTEDVRPNNSGWCIYLSASEIPPQERRPKVTAYDDPQDKSLNGKLFAVDNQLPSDEMKKLIEERGGFVRTTVTGKTDFLVINPYHEVDSSKRKKARELLEAGKAHMKIISYEDFFEMIRKR
jgi:hypothetical protein